MKLMKIVLKIIEKNQIGINRKTNSSWIKKTEFFQFNRKERIKKVEIEKNLIRFLISSKVKWEAKVWFFFTNNRFYFIVYKSLLETRRYDVVFWNRKSDI